MSTTAVTHLTTTESPYGQATGDIIAPGPFGRSRRVTITVVPEGSSGRQVFGGPQVPGPWAFTNIHATVIAAQPIAQPKPVATLAYGDPFTVDHLPGVWTLRAPRSLEGDAPQLEQVL